MRKSIEQSQSKVINHCRWNQALVSPTLVDADLDGTDRRCAWHLLGNRSSELDQGMPFCREARCIVYRNVSAKRGPGDDTGNIVQNRAVRIALEIDETEGSAEQPHAIERVGLRLLQ